MTEIILSSISLDELETLIIKSVAKALHQSQSSELVDKPETDRYLDLQELVKYDPEKRKRSTFYSYVHDRTIPFHKKGKKLLFLKSEIDTWLSSSKQKTLVEISSLADEYILNKKW